MPSSLNKVLLIGNLGRDAETRHTPSGTAVTTFSIATSRRTKDPATGEWRDNTDWHDIVLWRGDRVAPYLKKGKKVAIEGRLQTRSWDDPSGNKRYRTEVVCDPFGLILLGDRGDSGGGGSYGQGGGYGRSSSQPAPSPASGSRGASGGSSTPDDDDIPF